MVAPTAAETAFAAALAEIERVRLAGEFELRLTGETYADLQQIPSEIALIEELRSLNLDGTQISNLGPLSNQTTLKVLFADNTQIRELAPIADLTNMQMLSFAGTQVSDLTPVANLIKLTSLHISRTPVSDLVPLTNLIELSTLVLSQTQVSDLATIAHLTKLDWMSLFDTQVSDFAPLANLTDLKTLYLGQTKFSDLTLLAKLTALETLALGTTEVTDLRPIRDLPLKVNEEQRGLSFSNTPATEKDPELARLAVIEDNAERTRETLTYLNTLPPWPEPYLPKSAPDDLSPEPTTETPLPPEQDPGLPLIWGPRGFAFLASQIDTDPITEAALDDLRAMLDDLRRKGNRHDDLYRLACEIQDRAAGEISDLNLVRLHLSYQKLRRLYQSRDHRAEAFDDETTGVLGSVLEIVPAVTMADPQVAALIKRQEDERSAGRTPEADDAQTRVLETVQEPDAPFAPEVKDIATAILQPGHTDRLAATKPLLSRNTAMVVLAFVAVESAKSAVFGPVGNYVYEHSDVLLALARTMGEDAFLWAQMVLATFKSQFEIATGIAREASALGHLRLREKANKYRDLDKRPE